VYSTLLLIILAIQTSLFFPLEKLSAWLQWITYDIGTLSIVAIQAFTIWRLVPRKYKYTKWLACGTLALGLLYLMRYILIAKGYTPADDLIRWVQGV